MLGHDVRVAVRPGTAHGPPLMLCNGIGASLDLLQPFVDEADPRIEVVRFDVPGVGGSPAPKVPYNFAVLACFVGRLLDALGYDRFDVLGISGGGGLAQQLAFQHPRRCRRLVLVSTGTGMLMVPARFGVLSKMLTPRRYRDPAYAYAIAPLLYGGRMRRRPDEVRHVVHEQERLVPSVGYFLQLLAGVGWTSLPPCRSSGSTPWSSPGTTTPSSRWRTRGSCERCSPTPPCTSTTTATSGSSPPPTSSARSCRGS